MTRVQQGMKELNRNQEAREYCKGFKAGVTGCPPPVNAGSIFLAGWDDGRQTICEHVQTFVKSKGYEPFDDKECWGFVVKS